jgi:hypothetical protein
MCARTRLNADEAGQQAREELQQLRSGDALPGHHRAINIRLRVLAHDRTTASGGEIWTSDHDFADTRFQID